MIAWIEDVGAICSIGRYTIRVLAFLVAIITITASTSSMASKLTLKISITIYILVITRVMIIFYSLVNQFFPIIHWRFVCMGKKLMLKIDERFSLSNSLKKDKPVFWYSGIAIESNTNFWSQFLLHTMYKLNFVEGVNCIEV